MAYTCTGGVPSGHYLRVTVKGACQVPADAKIRVVGNVFVAAGGMFDAQTARSTITVGGSVTGARGSFVGLGCQPDMPTQSGHACTVDPTVSSTITVKGSVTAFGASTVLLNGITVKGDVSLIGGGGPIPWSIKNSTIGRNLTVAGQTTDWLGVLFNSVRGNVTLLYTKVTDTDPGAPGAYVVRNTIGQNLICAESPRASPGASSPARSTSSGAAPTASAKVWPDAARTPFVCHPWFKQVADGRCDRTTEAQQPGPCARRVLDRPHIGPVPRGQAPAPGSDRTSRHECWGA